MSEIKDNQLDLKTINQLLDYDFIVPDYQRGYRWTSVQVKQLLTDIWEFAKKENKSPGEFYCLQPIVVKKREENKYEVIDGQQRLTAIYLILKFIEREHLRRPLKEAYSKSIFKIEYDIRKSSKVFLENVGKDNNDDCNSNIDFFHICESYKAIKLWFKENNFDYNSYNKFLATFLAKEDKEYPVKVIWYEVEETENNNSIDIFTRLNIGKIPLTNSELIKALFLQKENFSDFQASLKQIQIASEWDTIEKTLQDDSFWFFIYNPNNPIKYDNRIEYIFDLMKNREKESEYYHTFNEFFKDFSQSPKIDIDKIWLSIKRFFLTFEEWYKDLVLFHYIGYLIDCGVPINQIKKESENKTKIEFKDYLKSKIKEQVNCKLDEIEYGDDNKRIKKILLLFNIQTILETRKSEMRFPFHKYKTENWDIEHVRSQTDRPINGNERKAWIDDMLDYFFGTHDIPDIKKIIKEINSVKDNLKNIHELLLELKQSNKIEDEKFKKLFSLIQKYFNEDKQTEGIDDISNLSLLDSATNRSYGNSFFPIKRKRIIENDSNGIFVPIATKNLFLKYYSKKVDDIMYWNESDAKDYLDAIKTKLKDFLSKEESNE